MKKIIDWHRSLVEKAQKELELTNYQLYWSGLLEGAGLMDSDEGCFSC